MNALSADYSFEDLSALLSLMRKHCNDDMYVRLARSAIHGIYNVERTQRSADPNIVRLVENAENGFVSSTAVKKMLDILYDLGCIDIQFIDMTINPIAKNRRPLYKVLRESFEPTELLQDHRATIEGLQQEIERLRAQLEAK
jgi:hypothetical protein